MATKCEIFCEILIAILLPPLGVCLRHGCCTVCLSLSFSLYNLMFILMSYLVFVEQRFMGHRRIAFSLFNFYFTYPSFFFLRFLYKISLWSRFSVLICLSWKLSCLSVDWWTIVILSVFLTFGMCFSYITWKWENLWSISNFRFLGIWWKYDVTLLFHCVQGCVMEMG